MTDESQTHKIVIVGGGLSAASMLYRLHETIGSVMMQTRSRLPIEIEIVEGGKEFFSGIAWNEDSSRPFHSVNTYISKENVGQVYDTVKHDGRLLDMFAHKPHEHGEISRPLYGKNRQFQAQAVVKALRGLGVKVTLTPETEVTNIKKDGNEYEITVANGEKKRADYVVLASGHWQNKTKMNGNKGMFPSPWPASRLEKEIDSNQPIAVLGTSLSATDAILTLAHKAGKFTKDKDGKVTFTPNEDAKKFKVVAYSPNGMLPMVHSGDPEEKDRKVNLKQEDARVGRHVTLDKMFTALKEEYLRSEIHASESPSKIERAIEAFLSGKQTPEEAVHALHEAYHKIGPKEWLRMQMDEMRKSVAEDRPIPWQRYLRRHVPFVEDCYYYFDGDDQGRFLTEIRSTFAKLAYGMVLSNAEEILALLESGHLDVRATGQESSLGTKHKGNDLMPGAEIRYRDQDGKEHADYYAAVVKATGDDPYTLSTSSALMKNLFADGTAVDVRVKYVDQAKGRREYARERQTVGPRRVVDRLEDGTYFRSAGGVTIDVGTYELIGRDHTKQDFLYALGPMLISHFPIMQGFGAMSRASRAISRGIMEDVLHHHDIQLTQLPEKPSALRGIVKLQGIDTAVAVVRDGPIPQDQLDAIAEFVAKMGLNIRQLGIAPISSIPPEVRDSLGAMMGQPLRD